VNPENPEEPPKHRHELDPRVLDDEMELRRHQVLRMRHRRMSLRQIGQALNVSEATVSKDLKWIREHWQQMLGPNAKLDTSVFIGESLAIYEDIEAMALTDAVRAGISLRDKNRCLNTALAARDRQVSLLQDMGVVARSLGTLTVNLPTATQIRAALAAAPFDPNDPAIIDIG